MTAQVLDIAAGDRTLFPFDSRAAAALHVHEDTGRALVRLTNPAVVHSDLWGRTIDKRTGLLVEVRRADCGSGCRCAAEVRVIEPSPGDALTWENPPHPRDRALTYAETCKALRERPGQWARVASPDRSARAMTLQERYSADGFESTVVKVGPEHRVYARAEVTA